MGISRCQLSQFRVSSTDCWVEILVATGTSPRMSVSRDCYLIVVESPLFRKKREWGCDVSELSDSKARTQMVAVGFGSRILYKIWRCRHQNSSGGGFPLTAKWTRIYGQFWTHLPSRKPVKPDLLSHVSPPKMEATRFSIPALARLMYSSHALPPPLLFLHVVFTQLNLCVQIVAVFFLAYRHMYCSDLAQ